MTDHPKQKRQEEVNEEFFDTDHLKADLKGRSVRAGTATIVAQIVKFGSQTVGTLILASLLAPEDFGLIGMVTIIISFIELFKDLGLSTATIQKSEINQNQVTTLFWINIGISCSITILTIGLAPAISNFYNEPRLMPITFAFSGTFILGGLAVQHQALLKRQMRFSSLASIETTATLSGVAVAILTAWSGMGYWAIVAWKIVQASGNALGVWIACKWRPGLPKWDPQVSSMLAFGGNIVGFNAVNYFSRNLDNILIGRYWGAQELGLYAMAYRLLLLPIQQVNAPITNVALPTLSRLQTEPERYCKYYYRAILLVTAIGMPIVCFTAACVDKLIPLLLGEQWLEIIPIFYLLIPAAFFGTFNVATGWAYLSLGQANRQFRQGVLISTINVILFILSVRWGAVGVAAAFGLSRPIIRIPSIAHCFRETPLTLLELSKTISQSAAPAILSAIIVFGFNKFLFSGIANLLVVCMDVMIYIGILLIIWLAIPNGKETLVEIYSLISQLIKSKLPKFKN